MSPGKIHASQAAIDTPLVHELMAAQFPQWAALPLEPVDSGGMVNAIYRLGSDLSVRPHSRLRSSTWSNGSRRTGDTRALLAGDHPF